MSPARATNKDGGPETKAVAGVMASKTATPHVTTVLKNGITRQRSAKQSNPSAPERGVGRSATDLKGIVAKLRRFRSQPLRVHTPPVTCDSNVTRLGHVKLVENFVLQFWADYYSVILIIKAPTKVPRTGPSARWLEAALDQDGRPCPASQRRLDPTQARPNAMAIFELFASLPLRASSTACPLHQDPPRQDPCAAADVHVLSESSAPFANSPGPAHAQEEPKPSQGHSHCRLLAQAATPRHPRVSARTLSDCNTRQRERPS